MAQVPPFPIGPSAGVPGSVPNQLSIETTIEQERALQQPGVKADELRDAPELGFWRLALIRFLHHRVATGALVILGLIVLSAVIVPIMRWETGYSYAFYRASYFLTGREVLPVVTPDNGRLPQNFRAAKYIALQPSPLSEKARAPATAVEFTLAGEPVLSAETT